MTSKDSTAPAGLPGRLMMIVVPRMPAVPRDKIARGVFAAPAARMRSGKPGITRSRTAVVASGVMSRGPKPVPPVVKMRSTASESAVSLRNAWMAAWSSARTAEETTSQPSCRQRDKTDVPERSSDRPAETESLIVKIETRMERRSAGRFDPFNGCGVALAFVDQAQRFH
jgi:hypothetical protein